MILFLQEYKEKLNVQICNADQITTLRLIDSSHKLPYSGFAIFRLAPMFRSMYGGYFSSLGTQKTPEGI